MLAMLTWLVPAMLLMAGGVLIGLGLRGRRVDDHPVCRKCGRDLFRLPKGTKVCPECGVTLTPARVRRGNRARRSGLTWVGVFVAVPALLWLAGTTAVVIAGTSADQYKPYWMLRRDADGDMTAYRAVSEFSRRLATDDLSASQISELVDGFLDDQTDHKKPWRPVKADFVELCESYGKLSPSQWNRYVIQGVSPALQLRQRVAPGRDVPAFIHVANLRLGSTGGAFSGPAGRGVPVEIGVDVVGSEPGSRGERRVMLYRVGGRRLALNVQQSGGGDTFPLAVDWQEVAEVGGATTLEVSIRALRAGTREWQAVPLAAQDANKWWVKSQSVTVVKSDVRVINDPRIAQVVRDGLQEPAARVALPAWWRRVLDTGKHEAYGMPDVEMVIDLRFRPSMRLPPACYAVFVDDGAAEHRVGTIRWDSVTSALSVRGTLASGFDCVAADRVRLILRPDIEAARQSVDFTDICGGEVVLDDVPVTYPKWYLPFREKLAVTRPSTRTSAK